MVIFAVAYFTIAGLATIGDLMANRDIITSANTFLNFLSVYLLVKASQRYRQEVAPKVARVEAQVDKVAAEIVHDWDGDERREVGK